MKTIASLLVVAFALLTFTGCKSPQQAAYTTLASIGLSVDKAMTAAAHAKVAGKISEADWNKIANAHGKFVVAYSTACDLAAYDYSRFAPSEVIALQMELLNTINVLLK